MSTITTQYAEPGERTFLGHPIGLFLLFFVEMWERFSYYGMRGILVLYLTSPQNGMLNRPPGRAEGFNPGPGWEDSIASNAYGWYGGMAYLTPIVGGIIADKFIGTHRSMIVGGILIALGHIALGVSGLGPVEHSAYAMTVFVLGLALIVIGTGHFKPSVSVMVGQLYKQGDPRREGAFGIFYMGINLGSAIQTYIVGTLGERVGWHWGFGAAAVGMILGLIVYATFRSKLLPGIGVATNEARAKIAPALIPIGLVVASLVAVAFQFGLLSKFDEIVSNTWVSAGIGVAAALWALSFIFKQRHADRGPVASIFIFMLFNAVFWLAFEQAGSSINIFTDRLTDRSVNLPQALVDFTTQPSTVAAIALLVGGFALACFGAWRIGSDNRSGRYGLAAGWVAGTIAGVLLLAVGILKLLDKVPAIETPNLVPTTWFQSINPWLIIVFAPMTGVMWMWLSSRNANPGQPYKIGIGLVFVGLGYLFMVWAALQAKDPAKAAMWLIGATYFVHTMGEIILSPTGLSFVTKAAPKEHVSLLMGVWFLSSFMANLGAGKVAAMVQPIVEGKKKLPWHLAGDPTGPNSQADFFFFFTVTSCGAGLLILVLGPVLVKLVGGRDK